MADVISFSGLTKLEVDPQKVLLGFQGEELRSIFIVAENIGGEVIAASSSGSVGDNLYLLEMAKKIIMESE